MSFVFLSYSREDISVASKLVRLLERVGIDVFWDQTIRFGTDYKKIIVDRLESAVCVLVLWSRNSAASHWVNYEADDALARGTLLEVRVDDSKPPPPFGVLNTADLAAWRGDSRSKHVRGLLAAIEERLASDGSRNTTFTLAAPLASQQVTDSHVTLIHSCWRTEDNDERFGGVPTYRWDIALYGDPRTLDRVSEVTYFLDPIYEQPELRSHSINILSADDRDTNFRLKQIANGTSLVRAHVRISGQTEVVKLSRYINLFDTPDRIDALLATIPEQAAR